MILREGALQFEFTGAMNGFKFDETDKSSTYYHGLSHCMKAVDFVVELDDAYLFVEVKDIHSPEYYSEASEFNNLVKSLVTKFRDSFLYRWAEEKTDKPIKYLCLVELENALVSRLMKELKRQLPEVGPNPRWSRAIAAVCVVANIDRWNRSFPNWPVNRVVSGEAS